MSETVTRSDKVIDGLFQSIFLDDNIQFIIIGISKEYGFDIRIVHTNMLHTVFLLVATGKFVFLNNTIHIIGNIRTADQSVLRLTVHCLRIDIIVFLAILHQPAFILKQLEILGRLAVNTFIMFVRTNREIYFRFNNMIKGFFITFRFCTCFCRIQYVVRTGRYLFHQILRGTNPFKGFNYSHKRVFYMDY